MLAACGVLLNQCGGICLVGLAVVVAVVLVLVRVAVVGVMLLVVPHVGLVVLWMVCLLVRVVVL